VIPWFFDKIFASLTQRSQVPATRRTIWKLDAPTRHVHGKGMCANIDPTRPGCEVYGADADGHTLTENRWLFAADGTLLRSGTDCPSDG
jgi:hypothetical protein